MYQRVRKMTMRKKAHNFVGEALRGQIWRDVALWDRTFFRAARGEDRAANAISTIGPLQALLVLDAHRGKVCD